MKNGPKEKRRNSEKRKEKSRDAARCRRSRESEIFYQLSNQLPLPHNISSKLDKATVMRLAISCLKIQKIMGEDRKPDKSLAPERLDQLYSKALEGFVLLMSRDGDVVYVSDQVAKYLGVQQIELMGHSIFDFSHPCDHDEIRDVLSAKCHNSKELGMERTFFTRMKCTLTSKGRNINLKSATYKVIKYTGKLEELEFPMTEGVADKENMENFLYLLAIGEPIPHPSNIEFPLDSKTFLTRHNMDMKFTFCDDRIKDLIGYNSDELIGKSVYDYHHALDSEVVEKAYKDLFSKGQTMTGQYRFLAKNGGYVQVISQATIISNSRTQKPQCVVCVHFVLSAVENQKVVLSDVQQSPVALEDILPPLNISMSTDKIFAPKTKDMEEGYYMPPEIKKDAKARNEPEDLTHLAPTAGDVCVPLTLSTFPPDSVTFDSKTGIIIEDILSPADTPLKKDLPFSSFKEEPQDMTSFSRCRDPPLLSPLNSSQASSPYTQQNSPMEYSKSLSPAVPDLMNKFSALDTNQALELTQEPLNDEDLDMRAPYIPMNTEDDFGLFTPTTESLFSMPGDFNPGFFGTTESVFVPKSLFQDNSRLPSPMPTIREMWLRESGTNMTQPARIVPPHQAKRPLERSCFEKGPPVAKVPKLDSGQETIAASLKDKSVLMNLLLTGEDRNHGYSVRNSLIRRVSNAGEEDSVEPTPSAQALLLPSITQQDCEVNAPTKSLNLLQGEDLIRALDSGTRPMSPIVMTSIG
ncbi:LOW QUALITY PROTEIN: hypoxia-inducible factor 1-alpha-like [Liolophura sinensis]|uniref:LOW QUALITY PROTEIN: hypoxia-inducible factor 1-alpha-like n=1 Tax=Liolophura sinensis TaxID=3198878 RepID=UPI0031596ABD